MTDPLEVRLERIAARLQLLASCDAELRVFGATHHGYRLDPPYGSDELAEVERAMGVSLPPEVRAFLTRVGSGGAGPYYGLQGPSAAAVRRWLEEPGPKPRFDHPFRWPSATGEEPGIAAGRYDGSLPIADQGCGMISLLVVTGPRAGEVWADRGLGEGPLDRESESFLVWYEGWLDAAFVEWARRSLAELAMAHAPGAASHPGVAAAAPRVEAAARASDVEPLQRAELLRVLGYSRLYGREWSAAEEAFEQARIDDREPARHRLDRARVRRLQGRWDEARDEIATGLAASGSWATHDELRSEEEQALIGLGRRAEALALLDARAAEHTWDLAIHHQLARERLFDGDVDGAHSALLRAVELGAGVPPDAEAFRAAILAGEAAPSPSLSERLHVIYDGFVARVADADHAAALTTRRPPG